MRPIISIALLGLALLMCGCKSADLSVATLPLRDLLEIPGANLPVSMRYRNWTDARGSGSCVIASAAYNHNWAGDPETARDWRRRYAGGQTETSIRAKHDAAQIPYYFTRSANAGFLDWVSRTRRSALIWFYPRHCVNFAGFSKDPMRPTDPNEYAWLCDNNRPMQFIRVPKERFLREWAGYGGFALARESPPLPPPLFDAVEPTSSSSK
ncbi:hypothetical protein V7x_20000 [Crateriforma conspicua]|uniref:Peptidase C39-like domain-containing protein n=1 Tax=Crateriforma conspicua TaxID=2527996 RepID=A0A5C6FVQ3_9PLAN|nr:hypothetical protein V7x_20000 [Crateriforma conspicua]